MFEFLEVYMTPYDVQFLFKQIDTDGSGLIEENEWAEFFNKAAHRDQLKQKACLNDAYLRDIFAEFDVEDREFLLIDDLINIVKFIGLNMSPNTVHDLFWEIDSSGNNKIELDEFLSFFEKINDEKELKETLEAYGKKQERAIYFYAAYCAIAVGV
jgi:Ca2+-binding EF-hand superfamily protein